jgi:uncharacterized protein YcfJ
VPSARASGTLKTVPATRRHRLPPGWQPYDLLNGLRVGALAGGLLGAIATVATSVTNVWLVFVGAAGGGAIGFWSERRSLRRDQSDPPEQADDSH